MAFTREFVRTAAKQSGVELPKELEDALINEHISTRDTFSKAEVDKALKDHKPEPIKVEDSEEYKALKSSLRTLKPSRPKRKPRQPKQRRPRKS